MDIRITDRGYWDDLIIDRLSGNLSADDRARLEGWLDESEEHRQYYSQMKELWDSSEVANPHFLFDDEKAYILFSKRCASFAGIPRKRLSVPWWKRGVAVAAVLVPFVFLSYFTALYFQSRSIEERAPLISEIKSPKGSRTQVCLADGSLVWLNSGSTISYADDFGKNSRTLKLSGEAYLEVARNEEIPFVVEAGGLEVKVLGTKFNVSAYAGDEDVKVFLLNGSVRLSGNEELAPVTLKPQEMAVYNTLINRVKVFEDDASFALNWMNNKLVFRGETMKQIAQTLQRYYDVKIEIHNPSVCERRFAGDFKLDDPIEKIFKVMAANEKFRYRIKGGIVDIY